jgi:uncharacterized membrane protein YhfC
MILMPILLGIYLKRKFGLSWRLWWIGAATFILSQVGHIPFNIAVGALFETGVLPAPPPAWELPFQAIFLGLSAGLWEELARYATYRWWAKTARSWAEGLMLGAGHGGIEAILLGLLVLATFVGMLVARSLDLSQMVPPEQLLLAQQQVQAYWSAPWYDTLIGALERATTLVFHLAASLLVLQVFLRRQIRWLWLAVAWHALLDALAVFSAQTWGIYVTEAILVAFALINLGIIFLLRPQEPESSLPSTRPGEQDSSDEVEPQRLPEVEETPENLEKTRYN